MNGRVEYAIHLALEYFQFHFIYKGISQAKKIKKSSCGVIVIRII